jgi:hypothetical protein
MAKPEKVTPAIREIFRQYVEAVRGVVVVYGRCYVKGWPDRSAAIAVLTRMGHLNCDCELLRFDYLVESGLLERETCNSIATIHDRLWKDWQVGEETSLKETSERYREVLAKMDADQALLDPSETAGPAASARGDPEMLKVAEHLRLTHQALEEQLQKLATDKSP